MSFKNDITNLITKKLIKKAFNEKMVEIIATAREDVKYDENGYRISNFKVPKEYKYLQYFCNNIRLEEMYHQSFKKNNNEAKIVLFFHGGGYI